MTAPTTVSSRDSWATRLGFILAAVGSAVGLGNMWRFSYVAAEGGGAAFVVVYLLFVGFIGIPIMTAEFVVGRMTQISPALAVKRLGGTAWLPLGALYVFSGFGILSYYSVIAGWTMRYAADGMLGRLSGDTTAYFQSVATGAPAVIAHLLFMAITVFIVIGGVKRGLERTAFILMPLLFLLLIGLALWAATLTDAGTGYSYYLRPQLRELLNPNVIGLAAGQAFFSLSLGMGALMTYASYLKSRENLGKEAATVALTDFGVAFVAGLVVFPIIMHFGLGETIGLGAISDNTVGTLFIALPAGLQSLGTVGTVVTVAFFVMLFFAALTSAISLLEVVVAAIVDGWRWARTTAALVAGAVTALAGLPAAFSLEFLDAADKLVGNFLLIAGGLFTSILVGHVILSKADAELAEGLPYVAARRAWALFVRWVAPVVLIIVLYFSAPPTWSALKTLLGIG
ncbi:MAG: sodium-dependent transporter [Gemmatimonadales bacterium]